MEATLSALAAQRLSLLSRRFQWQCSPRKRLSWRAGLDRRLQTFSKRSFSTQSAPKEKLPKMTVVLDMDECLLHSIFLSSKMDYRQLEQRPDSRPYEDNMVVQMETGEYVQVNKRPGLEKFLKEVCKRFDTYVFTAAMDVYAGPVLDALEQDEKLFKGRFYRPSCSTSYGIYVKDLSVVKEDLSRVVLIDNNPASFVANPRNGIPVPDFFDQTDDKALAKVLEVLDMLEQVEDVRPVLHKLFGIEDFLKKHYNLELGGQEN